VLAGTRLLTLTGAGGVGKTRLALHVAGGLLAAFPDGVWLIQLAPLADPALLPQAVAAPLGVQERPRQPLLESLVVHLRPRALLLVLDSCEHLVDACTRLAERLLADCPALRILATSREPLSIPGEAAWRVPCLAAPDPRRLPSREELARYPAVRLSVERARADGLLRTGGPTLDGLTVDDGTVCVSQLSHIQLTVTYTVPQGGGQEHPVN